MPWRSFNSNLTSSRPGMGNQRPIRPVHLRRCCEKMEYTVHDGRLIDGGTEASEQQTPSGARKVDALEMRKACAGAGQLVRSPDLR